MLSYKAVFVIFENCREYEEAENCANEQKTNEFWANPVIMLLAMPGKQAMMKDMENPLHTVFPYS